MTDGPAAMGDEKDGSGEMRRARRGRNLALLLVLLGLAVLFYVVTLVRLND